MKLRFLKQTALFALLFFVAWQCFNGVIFLLSHLPPGLVHLDWLLRGLGHLSRFFTWPRRFLRSLWPAETTPAALDYLLALLNWLLWGALAALWKALRLRRTG